MMSEHIVAFKRPAMMSCVITANQNVRGQHRYTGGSVAAEISGSQQSASSRGRATIGQRLIRSADCSWLADGRVNSMLHFIGSFSALCVPRRPGYGFIFFLPQRPVYHIETPGGSLLGALCSVCCCVAPPSPSSLLIPNATDHISPSRGASRTHTQISRGTKEKKKTQNPHTLAEKEIFIKDRNCLQESQRMVRNLCSISQKVRFGKGGWEGRDGVTVYSHFHPSLAPKL